LIINLIEIIITSQDNFKDLCKDVIAIKNMVAIVLMTTEAVVAAEVSIEALVEVIIKAADSSEEEIDLLEVVAIIEEEVAEAMVEELTLKT